MKNLLALCFTLFLSLPVSVAHATAMQVASNGNCSTNDVQIGGIKPITAGGLGSNVGGMTYPIDATRCLGYVTDPDNDWGNDPSPNIGALGDGLLNEEISNQGYYIPGDYFLTNPKDSMVDLDGDGDATDPGWIRLGGSETGGTGEWSFEYDFINGYDLDAVLDITFGTTVVNGEILGYWSLFVDPLAIPFATQALGRPSIFDHLAFVLKGPNTNRQGEDQFGEWAVYDFNFHDLIDDGLDVSLGDTAYFFEGTWDAANIFDGKDTSHISIWAHDPPAGDTEIPLPTTLTLLLLGLVGLGANHSKKPCR